MKFKAGYMTCYSIETENAQDMFWLDDFIKNLYKDAKVNGKETTKLIDKMYSINLEDCVGFDKDKKQIPIGFCTVSEYANRNGWSKVTLPKGLEFNMDY